MTKVLITVEKSNGKKGYQLRHNQQPGFKGIIGMTWTWYKYKSDAVKSANELMNCYNNQ